MDWGNTAHTVITSVDSSISSPWGSGLPESSYMRSDGNSNESVDLSNTSSASASDVPALSRARCRSPPCSKSSTGARPWCLCTRSWRVAAKSCCPTFRHWYPKFHKTPRAPSPTSTSPARSVASQTSGSYPLHGGGDVPMVMVAFAITRPRNRRDGAKRHRLRTRAALL